MRDAELDVSGVLEDAIEPDDDCGPPAQAAAARRSRDGRIARNFASRGPGTGGAYGRQEDPDQSAPDGLLDFCPMEPGQHAAIAGRHGPRRGVRHRHAEDTATGSAEPMSQRPVRWSPSGGQFGGFVKLGSGSCQAANFAVSVSAGPAALNASSGVWPPIAECGRPQARRSARRNARIRHRPSSGASNSIAVAQKAEGGPAWHISVFNLRQYVAARTHQNTLVSRRSN